MKNTVIVERVVDYSHDGKGIVKKDGIPIFVKDVLLNELVEVKIIKWKNKFGYGKVLKVIEESLQRIKAPCKYNLQCGGCQLQIMNYQEQLKFKCNKIKNAFNKQKIYFDQIEIIANEQPFNYRNKLAIPLNNNERVYAGLYRENSNDIIEIDNCLIQKEIINTVLNKIIGLLNKYTINIYDKVTHKGFLRQIVIKTSNDEQRVLVVFVVNQSNYQNELDQVIDELVVSCQKIKGVIINFNSDMTNVILGNENKTVYGRDNIIDIVNDYHFQISTNSFYQVNALQMNELYIKACQMADLQATDIVLDSYCGIGTISLYVSKYVKQVVGVDIVKSAIDDAKKNKQHNSINNVTFVCQDTSIFFNNNNLVFDCLFVDPPRKGCSQKFLDDIVKNRPKKIIYIACDPATQARDIKYLIDNNYVIGGQCAVDMFSQTYHVENIVSLKLAV